MMRRDEMLAALKTNFVARVPALRGVTIGEQDSFHSLGGHSLALSQAVSDTLQQLRLTISREQLLPVRNVGELLDLMERVSGR
jgi:acyl carrier protein